MKKTQITRGLRGSTALSALVLAGTLFAAPAFAQETPAPTTQSTTTQTTEEPAAEEGDIVVTGSLFRTTTNATPSPVTTVNVESLEQRGISTIQDAIQQLASNNGPALTNSFTANGAFAAGASAVSLRGLSTNSTLVLFDGMRAAYYPLADDGSRNFVDLNTIPDDIIDRIEVLRDGASSTYGADAIAGVVNIITKKEVKGVSARLEAGISERGDAATKRMSLTVGHGDLDEDGFNAYLSGFYYKSDILYNRDRPYPYNSDDLRNVCQGSDCGPNNVVGGVSPDGIYRGGTPTSSAFYVRPASGTTGAPIGGSIYQPLGDLAANCVGGTLYNLNAADRAVINPATGTPYNISAPNTICQSDYTKNYGVIQPNIERFGVSGRFTANLNDTTEAYFEANFIQSRVDYTGFPATIRGTANTGILFPQFSTATGAGPVAPGSGILALPVYVCPMGVGSATGLNTGCNAVNGTLNPNNPFAAQGQTALLVGRILSQTTYNETRTRAYRAAMGIDGSLSDTVSYRVGATAMHVDLQRTQRGYVYIDNLLTSIARGTFNFVNPNANSQQAWDFLMPENRTNASSDQYQFEASLAADLIELPGGPLKVGGGVSIRYESVDAPSGNPDTFGPTQRYFTLNAFGTEGNRTVKSAFAELDAPIMDFVSVNASGRYDSYSSGQDAFSPKVGLKVTPIKSLVVRGTYSRGFRIPSFGEANALPTTGFVANSAGIFNNTFLAQYGCNTGATSPTNPNGFSTCPAYIRTGSYGQTTLASPDLEPEKSRSFTAGAVFEPVRGISFTVDYYNIKKTGAITQPSNAPALAAYYNNQPIPAGYTVIADAPDPNFMNARPRVAFVQSQLINANTIKAEGLDFSASVDVPITDGFRIQSSVEASYIINLSTEFPDGSVESYEGTIGNYNLTAGSGTPEWHGSWQTTLDFGDFDVTGTANYFGGYNLSAEDQTGAGTAGDCGLGDVWGPCDVSEYITFDLNARIKINDQFTFYGTVNNLFDKMPPIDIATYGAHMYNPVQGGNGILGRYFRAGVRVGF
ncbi:MAG: TonB-dependent receptor [Sphingomonas sp.]|uniref:TonB-dependent receptor domain-containing protein n=1 Tax=Sphingomonas sp. TaxID=28214 RepID=UPI002275F0D5|nr:TonB-dependent receptor [Sphingomonas sp.]MCX8475248.1 TonB-dependent receptor [Sphingomonas sp.]